MNNINTEQSKDLDDWINSVNDEMAKPVNKNKGTLYAEPVFVDTVKYGLMEINDWVEASQQEEILQTNDLRHVFGVRTH